MKFYGQPFEQVRARQRVGMRKRTVPIFQFDENGEYETNDKKLIEALKPHYKHQKPHVCKKCGEEFENKGLLLAHYRHHKKR
ncbi:MAG: hypothetical protein M0P77_10285 [Firmicutes bacterium]|nr:hypothetical protein [Bacillota bacterium]